MGEAANMLTQNFIASHPETQWKQSSLTETDWNQWEQK